MSEQTTAAAPAASGQGTASVTGAPGSAGAESATADWTSGFNDELKGWAMNKGFKNPVDMVDSYRNYEKLIGTPKERLVKLPEKDDDPNWGDVWDKLGRPKEAKEYNIEVPKEFGDEKFAEWAKENFHKLNMPRKQAEGLTKAWNEYTVQKHNEQKQQMAQKLEADHNSLKREWGAAFDQNINLAKQAAQSLGFDAPTIDALESALGFSGVMKMMHSLQAKVGEDNFVGSSQSSSAMGGKLTPGQAKARIEMLKADPDFTRRYINNESGPREEMNRLHGFLYPDG